ncbi:GBF-interacting protein 1 [Linum grandiflorum]
MSGKGNHGGKVSNGISAIPPGSRKVVQSLKEIVNCPESEIYAMLKDCDMDPNEAVNRLLTQDPFHEVKSKREKKKETKDTTDLRPRGGNNVAHRGARSGSDRYGRGGSSQFRSTGMNKSSVLHGKPAYRKENGAHAYAGSTSYASATAGNNGDRRAELTRDFSGAENKTPTISAGDDFFAPAQPPSGVQSAWIGNPGQVSMADIVKMGKPQSKTPALPNHTANDWHGWAPPAHNDIHPSENGAPKVSEIYNEQEAPASQYVYSNNDWPSTEQPSTASVSSFMEPPTDPDVYEKPSTLASLDRENEHVRSEIDEVQSEEDDLDESPVGSSSVPNTQIQEDVNGGSSILDNDLYENINSYESNGHAFERNDVEDSSSSMAANLQQLNLHTDDTVVPPEEDNPVVIIPNHLQVHAQDCPHLSFGSFGSGIGSGLSGPFASHSLSNNLEETSEMAEAPAAGHSDARDPEYYADEHLRNAAEDDLVHRTNMNASNYDSPSVPQPQVLKEESQEVAQGDKYPFLSSGPGYNFDNSQHLEAALRSQQSSSQLQNIADFSSVMQAYSNSLPSALLASNLPTGREPDLSYSPFPTNHTMPTKYNTTASSVNGPSISMPEASRASSISTQQSLGGAAVAAMGHALPQHLAVHPYSQPNLPLGHYANMIGYPFMPQSYAYMPSAFQQAFPGNSTYHQSLAAVLPQYKNNVAVSSLPQSAAVPSGYGFGGATGAPAGSSPHNQPAAPAAATLRYDDVLSSQYKDNSHLMSLQQQNENSAMWLQGHGSRTMSAAPANSYYNFQGQNQQQQQLPSGFRQGQQQQQPSQQHFSALGYPNYYHSQAGMSLEHQQQNTRDGSMGVMQGQGGKQTQQQLWQNSY